MDLEAILERAPAVALVDEMAHTNINGSRNDKRWQDINEILDAGIDVITTVNVQHLASLNDVVEQIAGVAQRETVPDAVVRAADQIELVDMSPEALRRRMAHGNIYPTERVDAALAHYFRVGNLGALRELALLWVADRVDDELQSYRERHGISQPWETKERVVVALTGAPQGDRLLRRGARMAARVSGDLVGVHVRAADGLARADSKLLEAQRRLLQLGSEEFLRRILLKSHADIDEWQTQMQLKPMAIGTLQLYSTGLSPAQHALTGVRSIESVRSAVLESIAASGDPAVAVIPEGPYVVPFCR